MIKRKMSKKYRILHITPTDVRYDSRIIKELKALENLVDSQLLAFGINDDEGHKYDVKPLEYVRTFNLISKKLNILPRPIRYFVNLLEAIIKLTIPAIRFKPNVIHCHDTLYLPIALLVKIFCKSKLVYDAHELESDKAGQSKILSNYTLVIEKIAWKHIDYLISVSPSIIDWYNVQLGKKESELIMNSPILDSELQKNEKSNYLREKFQIPSNKKIFLYLGIISQKGRGIELYLEAFQKKDVNSHLVFIGYGEFTEEVKKIANQMDNIHYHPAVPHHEVVKFSKSADVGLCMIESVSLSDYYSLPNKLFEYAFSGLYVLASDFPDIKQLVDTYDLGKCSSLETQQIYQTIKSIEELEIVKTNYDFAKLYPLSWLYQAEKLIKLYKKILNN